MATLTAVEELPSIEREGNARVAGPIIEDFVASGMTKAKVEETEGKAQSTKAILQKYAQTRKQPVKVYVRGGEVFLVRLSDDELATEQSRIERERADRAARKAAKANASV